jgi:hypothetical protein
MAEELKAIGKEDENGSIKYNSSQVSGQARSKNVERSNIKTFSEFMNWVEKHYKSRIDGTPLQYFYKHYVKTLRLYS